MATNDRYPHNSGGENAADASANAERNTSGSPRDKYRDNDDVRDPVAPADRNASRTDSASEARGDARENIGNHSRGTAASPTGPEGNDRQAGRPRRDEFDDDLARDDRKSRD